MYRPLSRLICVYTRVYHVYDIYIEGVTIISPNPVDTIVVRVELFRHREEYFERLEIFRNLRTEEKGETLVGC